MSGNEDELIILWTSGDKEVALNMVFMYALKSKLNKWWNNIRLIIWGPSARLVSEDSVVQGKIREMTREDITVDGCKTCADNYRVSEYLEELGVNVRRMGELLTKYLKENRKIITF